MCGSPARSSTNALVSRDFPIPASPESSTTWPSPSVALNQRRLSNSNSSSRPTRAVKSVACSASKRLATELACSTAHHRPGNTLEAPHPKVSELEETTEKSSRAFGDDDRVRFGDALKARRKVWRLAYHAALLRLTRWDQVPDHDQTGCNTNTDLLRRMRLEASNYR